MSSFMEIRDRGITWIVRVVDTGEGYGQWIESDNSFVLTNTTDKLLVEFYDTRHNVELPFNAQFVSRYFVKDLLNKNTGLCLSGGVPSWSISSAGMEKVRTWLESYVKDAFTIDDPANIEYFTVAGTSSKTNKSVLKTFEMISKKSDFTTEGIAKLINAKAEMNYMKPPFVVFDSDSERTIVPTGQSIYERIT